MAMPRGRRRAKLWGNVGWGRKKTRIEIMRVFLPI